MAATADSVEGAGREASPERPMPPAFDARTATDKLTGLFGVEEVRGGFWIWLFRRALGWGLGRASRTAALASRRTSWLEPGSAKRLRVESVRELAWTGVLEDDARLDEISRAAALVVAALEFRAELRSPTCSKRRVEQCGPLFDTTLLPRGDGYEVHHGRGRHVLVGVGGSLCTVLVLNEDGSIRDEADIADDLRACVKAKIGDGAPVLALTTAPRVDARVPWSSIARDSPEATESLCESIFSVFLDPSSPADIDTTGRLAQGGPPENRCFWHGLQLVVFRNGKAAAVGSWVAGIEGEGALELLTVLGAARAPSKKRARKRRDEPATEPMALAWTVSPEHLARLSALAERPPANAGGYMRVPRFGRSEWADAGINPETATVLAIRLALDAVAPNLDDLDCMVNLAHFESGTVRRVSTATPAMRQFLEAAKEDGKDLGPPLAAASLAQRARVRRAKRLETAKLALEFSVFALGYLSGLGRWLLRLVVGSLGVALTSRATAEEKKQILSPRVAVSSSVSARPGLAAFGRFGVLAPTGSVWIHHTIAENETRFVFQLGREQIAQAKRLRETIPVTLARVMAAAREAPKSVAEEEPTEVSGTLRIACRDVAYLMNALKRERAITARRQSPPEEEGEEWTPPSR